MTDPHPERTDSWRWRLLWIGLIITAPIQVVQTVLQPANTTVWFVIRIVAVLPLAFSGVLFLVHWTRTRNRST